MNVGANLGLNDDDRWHLAVDILADFANDQEDDIELVEWAIDVINNEDDPVVQRIRELRDGK